MSVSQHSMSARVRMGSAYRRADRRPRRANSCDSERRAEVRKRPRVEVVARKQAWDPEHLPDLTGRTYLVTGSNAGLGYFSSEQLVRAGARVFMTGRSPNRLAAARAAVRRRVPDAADRASRRSCSTRATSGSVRAAAATIARPRRARRAAAQRRDRAPAEGARDHRRRQRGRLRDERARPLRARRRAADDAGGGIRAHGVAGQHVDLDVRSTTRSTRSCVDGLHRLARLRAVEGRDRGARLRGRPPAARGGRAGHERRRAPGVLDERPHARHRRRERARPGSRGSPTTCSSRSRSPRSTARGRSCAHSSIPTSRAASSGVRSTWLARRAAAGRAPRRSRGILEVAERLWGVCEDATGVRWPFADGGARDGVTARRRATRRLGASGAEPDRLGGGGGQRNVIAGDPQGRRHPSPSPSAPTATPAASTARSSSGSRSLTRSTRPVWPGAASASSTKGSRWTCARGIRNRVAVRVEPGPPEALVDALEQAVADRVLEHLGLVVHLVPRVAELAHQPGLDQAVAADDGCRAVLAGRASARSARRGGGSRAPARRASAPSR